MLTILYEFHILKGHVTLIMRKVNRIPMHCGVAYESVCSLASGHLIRVCIIYAELTLLLYHAYMHMLYINKQPRVVSLKNKKLAPRGTKWQ